tara:strand:+ start:2398 stop:3345 length:948 start_codon:yes stop_codon:yes gene_type:complete
MRLLEEKALAALRSKLEPAGDDVQGVGLLEEHCCDLVFDCADVLDLPLKGEMLSLEIPFFSLERKDLLPWSWISSDGNTSVQVACSQDGRATMKDKDILIFCVSQIIAALNMGAKPGRTLRFGARAFLQATNRGTRGDDYRRLRDSLKRLKGTLVTVETRGKSTRSARQVSFIDEWSVLEKGEWQRVVTLEVTLSVWFFGLITKRSVLTIERSYFSLGPLQRRLYEIARKHVGNQAQWQVSLEQLRNKTGSRVARIRKFEEKIQEIIDLDCIPVYRLSLISSGQVKFYQKDQEKYARASFNALVPPVDKSRRMRG